MAQTVRPAYQVGQLFTSPDAQADQDADRNLVGSAIAGLLGIPSANSVDAPFTVSPAGGMTISAGGSGGQKVLLNSASGPRLVDSIPTQTFTVPTADGTNTRNDLLCGTYAQTQVASGSVTVGTLSGSTLTTSSVTGYNATEALTYQYVTGTPSSSPVDPSVPAGYVALARIVVPATTTSISSGNITVLLTSAQSQILSGVTGYVDTSSNQVINGNKTFNGQTNLAGLHIGNSYAGAGLSVNGTGSVALDASGTGSLYLGYNTLSLGQIVIGPLGEWATISSGGFTSSGTFSITNTGTQTVAGLLYGNNTSGSGKTALNARGSTVQGVTSSIFGIENVGVSTLLALDASGDLGIAGSLYAAALSTTGSVGIGGTLTVGGNQLPNTFESTDASVNVSNSSGVLNVTLPSGVINSYISSDFSVNVAQTGRQLNLTLPSGYISSYSTDGSMTLTQTGRNLTISISNSRVPVGGMIIAGDVEIANGTSPNGASGSISIPGYGTWFVIFEAYADMANSTLTLSLTSGTLSSSVSYAGGTATGGTTGITTATTIGRLTGYSTGSGTYIAQISLSGTATYGGVITMRAVRTA